VIDRPLHTIVYSEFDWTRTEILGAQKTGDKIDNDISFNIILKDNKGYCYDFSKTVKILAKGPYST